MILQLSFQDDTLKAEFLNPRNQQIINQLLVKNVESLMPNPFFDGAHSSSLPMSGLENVIHWGLPILANKAGVITITTITYAQNDEAHQQVYEIIKLLYPKAQHLFG